MKRHRLGDFLATLCLLGGTVAAGAAPCVFHQEALPDAPLEPGAKDESRVTLLAVDPPEGKPVTASTIVKIDVEYHVADFQPNSYQLSAQFFTLGSGTVSALLDPDRGFLPGATGRVRLCAPLRTFYDHGSMRWPLSFQVALHEVHRRRSNVKVESVIHTLFSADTPPASLALQARMPSREYQQALLPVFSFFETQAAVKQVCTTRFNDLAPGLAQKYDSWLAPYAAFSERVSKEQLDLYWIVSRQGNTHAEGYHGRAREMVTEKYQLMPDFAARRNCEGFIRALGTPMLDPELRLTEHLKVLRDPKQQNPSDAT